MTVQNSDSADFREALKKIADNADLEMAIAVHDFETGSSFDVEGDRWFHAASLMKAALLWALMDAAAHGTVHLEDPLHVRNRFLSAADGSVFRISGGRDADGAVHRRLGKTMPLQDLAHAMITRSSNLATNLLVDHLTVDGVMESLDRAEITGLEIVRGVEDDAAFEAGINNRVTANGLRSLFKAFCEGKRLPATLNEKSMSIFYEQEFTHMIPAGLPEEARVAHKTGDISTVCHDAGIVTLPHRAPYVVAILSEGAGELKRRKAAVAAVSRLVYERLTEAEAQ